MGWQVHGVWQVLGRGVSPREVSRILFEIHIGALKMQMGWQGLGGVVGSRWQVQWSIVNI